MCLLWGMHYHVGFSVWNNRCRIRADGVGHGTSIGVANTITGSACNVLDGVVCDNRGARAIFLRYTLSTGVWHQYFLYSQVVGTLLHSLVQY